MAKGGAASTGRTPEETATAKFWDKAWIGVLWAEVAQEATKTMNVADTSRLYAALFTAFADARTAAMDSKFTYNLWRPQTAIPQGNGQGWPADTAWTSLVDTPATPEYPSDNAAAGAVAATVLAKATGSDNFNFNIKTYGENPQIRSYTSFSQAATEEGEGRMLGGEHFRFSIDAGADLGRRVANKAISTYYPGTKNLRA